MKSLGVAMLALIGLAALDAVMYLSTPPPPRFDAAAAVKAAALYDARIVRDAFGVPHVFGRRDADAAFGLAYAHAEDDWATFEETLLFTRGTLAARMGKEAAATDFLVAALGVWPSVRARYDIDLSAETRAIAEAYAAGLNYYCAEAAGRCARGVAPVTGRDIVAGFAAKTPFFYGLDEALKALFEDPENGDAVRASLLRLPPGLELGSNAFAIAPSRSSDGAVRLVVNSHQPFTGPVAWYEARVQSGEGWDMIGGVFPGAPLVLHGASPDLGWAFTVNKPDLVDDYSLVVDDERNPKQYLFDGQWRDFEISTAHFRVHLFGPFSLPVSRKTYRSVHGPAFKSPRGWRAISYAGDGDIRAMEQWRRMNKARSYEEWRSAVEMQAIPSFNIIYADRQGRIAYFYNAALSERSPRHDWTKTADGQRADLVRGPRLPMEAAPSVVDPASGFVVNANNEPWLASAPEDSPVADDYPAHLGVVARPTNRGLRAQALLGADLSISGDELISYKMDDRYDPRSLLMQTIKALLEDETATGDPALSAPVELLRSWGGSADRADRAAALAIRFGVLRLGPLLNGEGADILDSREALAKAAADVAAGFNRLDPPWGDVNTLSRGTLRLPLDGGPDTLRAIYTAGSPAQGPTSAAAGDSYIMVIEWDSTGKQRIRTIHQFGAATQSVASGHYADQAPLFAEKRFKNPPMTLNAVMAEATRDYSPGGD